MVGKAQKSRGARSGLYDGCSNGVPPILMSASTAPFQSHNADAPLRLLRHPKKGSFKITVTPFSKSGWSVVKSASLAKGCTSKQRPSPHLHKVPTQSNKVSPRTLQMPLVLPPWQITYNSLIKCLIEIQSINRTVIQFHKINYF
jgi:hypothetical protein